MEQTELMTINLAEWDEPKTIGDENPEGITQRDLERGLRFAHDDEHQPARRTEGVVFGSRSC
jgi:hypothetical protein